MYCYGVVGTDGLLIPDLLIDLVDGEYFSGILHQKQQDVVFNGGQLDLFVVYVHFLGIIVDLKAAAAVNGVGGLLA